MIKDTKTIGLKNTKYNQNSLCVFATQPGGSKQDLTDALAVRVVGEKGRILEQDGHLADSELPDGLHADGHVHHLVGEEPTVLGALHLGKLHQHAHVPLKVHHVLQHGTATVGVNLTTGEHAVVSRRSFVQRR